MANRLTIRPGDTVSILVSCDKDDPLHTSAAVLCNQKRAGVLDTSRIVPVEYTIEWVADPICVLNDIWHLPPTNYRSMKSVTATLATYAAIREVLIRAAVIPKSVLQADKKTWTAMTWSDFEKKTPQHVKRFCYFVGKAFGKDHANTQRQRLTE